MGMVACYVAVSPQMLDMLISGEESIEEYLYPDDGDSEPSNSIDLDKSWHGIHYLLNGTSEGGERPLSMAVIGGVEFGPEVGYGPARYLTVAETADVAKALDGISISTLRARFDPSDMLDKDIYPSPMWERDGQEALAYALEYFHKLSAFYREAAARGDAAIQWIC
ncbi:MAG: YfbM family protein [Pseudomonadota bacterium]